MAALALLLAPFIALALWLQAHPFANALFSALVVDVSDEFEYVRNSPGFAKVVRSTSTTSGAA